MPPRDEMARQKVWKCSSRMQLTGYAWYALRNSALSPLFARPQDGVRPGDLAPLGAARGRSGPILPYSPHFRLRY
jgi:hypothetical protein